MLQHLNIQNYAIVDELDIELDAGMTAITGETGAGKSIMLDALILALGGRADASVIAPGKKRADICATIDVQQHPVAQQWLTEQAFDDDADHSENSNGSCLLRRSISREGRSRAWINGQAATLQQLKQIGSLLIDVHSQHEHQSLLQKDSHRLLLDAFSGCQANAKKVRMAYQSWQQCQQQLDSLSQQSNDNSAQQQLLRYQVEELDALNLQSDELAAMETEQKQLTHAEELLNSGQQALSLLVEGRDDGETQHGNALPLLQQACRLISQQKIKSTAMQEAEGLLLNACIQVEEACVQLDNHQQSVELNPERLQTIEQRLSSLYQVARKHHIKPEQLCELHTQLAEELETLSGSDDDLEGLQAQLLNLQNDYQKHSSTLSTARSTGAKKLNKAINKELERLNMPGCALQISLQERETTLHPHGAETIEFLIRTNPGQQFQSLKKVASGGELSRISLAIQVVTAKTSQTPTLIFDEVDVGIGGETAGVVGELLHDLGKNGQVLCVTHQASVAAKAHQHLFVTKAIHKGKVSTALHQLNPQDRIDEVARMIGGKQNDDSFGHAQAHAKSMLLTG